MSQKNESILVVDLDGTLISSDILIESFWSALAKDWRILFTSILALCYGRLALKNYLASAF